MSVWRMPGGNSAGSYERNSRRLEARTARLEKRIMRREERRKRTAKRALEALARGDQYGEDAR
jgi:hypothetical protein